MHHQTRWSYMTSHWSRSVTLETRDWACTWTISFLFLNGKIEIRHPAFQPTQIWRAISSKSIFLLQHRAGRICHRGWVSLTASSALVWRLVILAETVNDASLKRLFKPFKTESICLHGEGAHWMDKYCCLSAADAFARGKAQRGIPVTRYSVAPNHNGKTSYIDLFLLLRANAPWNRTASNVLHSLSNRQSLQQAVCDTL